MEVEYKNKGTEYLETLLRYLGRVASNFLLLQFPPVPGIEPGKRLLGS